MDEQVTTTKLEPVAAVAGVALVVSMALAATPFLWPTTAVFFPLLALNWVLLMLTGYLAYKPWSLRTFTDPPRNRKTKAVGVVVIAFTLAAWLAVLSGEIAH